MRHLQCWTATNIGLIRDENQDRVEAKKYDDSILAVVCDGMGGERHGSQASAIAVREFIERFQAGYGYPTDANENHIQSVEDVKPGDSINIRLMDGKIHSQVTSVEALELDWMKE